MSAWIRSGAWLAGLTAFFPAWANAMIPQDFPVLDPDPLQLGVLGADLEFDRELIPVFRAGARDRLGAGVHGAWSAGDRLLLDGTWRGLLDLHPDGQRTAGPGDLELGALVRLPVAESARAQAQADGRRGPSLGLGWRVKLPNAADEGELGSDESDVALLLAGGADLGPLRGWFAGGLSILGDPTMLAAQDDIVFLQLGLGWQPREGQPGWLPRTRLQGDWALPSAANPARAELGASLAWGRRWSVGFAGAAGLTPASPTASAQLVLERRFLGASGAEGSPEGR